MAYAFTLDEAGGAEVLQVMAAEIIAAKAQEIAAAVGDTAQVESHPVKRRVRASVSCPAFMQAKDGVLSRAAIASGLDFNPAEKRAPRKKPTDKTTKPRRSSKKPSA